jgi:hypothetical protein
MENTREGHSIEELKKYYEEVIRVATALLKENEKEWKPGYEKYLKEPDFKKHMEYWFFAYKNCIREVERKTETTFYFTTQGSASLRYNGTRVIKDLNCVKNKGKKVFGTINGESRCLNDPETIQSIKGIVSQLQENETKRIRNSLESYYEAGILKALNEDNKKKKNSFYRHIKPIKRLNNGKTGNEKKEIGLFQMNTPFKASEFKCSPEHLIYAGSAEGGGIDILARRGKTKWDSTLTLIEIKNEYDRSSEPPEVAMGQLMAYAVFLCNLIDEDPFEWGRAFGYMKGYNKKELTLIVMMPMPEDNNPPRKDFLSEDESGSDIEMNTLKGTQYALHLHYAYFNPKDYNKVEFSSLQSLD